MQTRVITAKRPNAFTAKFYIVNNEPAKPHRLDLPTEGKVDALLIGDSLTSRLISKQTEPDVIARGFGGHFLKSLLERAKNTKQQQVKKA